MSDQPSRFPVVYKNEWMVQVWKDKNTCFFAYFARPPKCKDMHGHTIHASYEIALADAYKQAGIEWTT